jgi:hypothetical protein
MGYYIQANGHHNKAKFIMDNYGGMRVDPPASYSDIPEGMALIVVVDNGPFEAAGFCYDAREFEAFTSSNEKRRRDYLLMDRSKAIELSGYKGT